jgi:phosphoribosylformimino-5-aminoimidazole carboxamide ribotide isomerase
MIAIPAMDLRQGACLPHAAGARARECVDLDDPLDVARTWSRYGFSRLHIVDLDAALGRGSNAMLVRELLDRSTAEAQVGGSLRTLEQVEEVLGAGARFAILGTRALADEEWLAEVAAAYPGEVILAAEVRQRRIVSPAWTRPVVRDVFDLLESLEGIPLGGLLVTSAGQEAEWQRSDLTLIEDIVEVARWPVIAAGGVACIDGLHALQNRGVAAAVIGTALYNGSLDPWAVAQEFAE